MPTPTSVSKPSQRTTLPHAAYTVITRRSALALILLLSVILPSTHPTIAPTQFPSRTTSARSGTLASTLLQQPTQAKTVALSKLSLPPPTGTRKLTSLLHQLNLAGKHLSTAVPRAMADTLTTTLAPASELVSFPAHTTPLFALHLLPRRMPKILRARSGANGLRSSLATTIRSSAIFSTRIC